MQNHFSCAKRRSQPFARRTIIFIPTFGQICPEILLAKKVGNDGVNDGNGLSTVKRIGKWFLMTFSV